MEVYRDGPSRHWFDFSNFSGPEANPYSRSDFHFQYGVQQIVSQPTIPNKVLCNDLANFTLVQGLQVRSEGWPKVLHVAG